jgi:hypothetical protein
LRGISLEDLVPSTTWKTPKVHLQENYFRLGAREKRLWITKYICLQHRKYVKLRRVGLVQLVSANSPSHQVLGSKPSLCRISAGVRLCFGYSLPQTPLVWEPLALGLPFIDNM